MAALLSTGVFAYKSHDFLVFYASAGRFVAGLNPYDFEHFGSEQVWSPPTVFGFIWIFSFFPAEHFELIWRSIMLVGFVWSMALMHIQARQDSGTNSIAPGGLILLFPLIVLLFPPTYHVLNNAPLLPFSLLGLALYFRISSYVTILRGRKEFISGMLLGLTFLKPHLFSCLYLALGYRAVRGKGRVEAAGFLTTVALLFVVASLVHPHILSQYLAAVPYFPNTYRTPTVGAHIAQLLNWRYPEIIFVPLIVGALFFARILFRIETSCFSDEQWRRFIAMVVLPLSILVAPYLWIYDFTLLLPGIFYLMSGMTAPGKLQMASFVIISGLVSIFISNEAYYAVWFPWLVGGPVLYSWLRSIPLSPFPILNPTDGRS